MSYFENKKEVFYYFYKLDEKGHRGEAEFADALESVGRFDGFTPKEVATILHRTARYITGRNIAPDAKKPLLDALQNHITPWAEKAFDYLNPDAPERFNGQELASIAWGFARLDMTLGDDFWSDWRAMAITTMAQGGMNGQDLANSLWALATLSITPDEDFLAAWQKAAITAMTQGGMNGQNLANSLWVLATLSITPDDDFLAAWQKASITTMAQGGMNGQDLANSLWALAVIDAQLFHPDHHKTAFELMCGLDTQCLNDEDRRQMLLARHHFGFGRFPASPWREPSGRSYHEDQLAHQFRSVAQVDRNYVIRALGHRLDMVPTHRGRSVLVEHDGDGHFNGETLNGGSILMASLMRGAEPDQSVWRVPYWVYDAMDELNESAQSAMWLRLLEQEHPIGAYQVGFDDSGTQLTLTPILRAIDYRQAAAQAYNIDDDEFLLRRDVGRLCL